MHTFTIAGEKYVPHDNSLFQLGDEITSLDQLEESQSYLHEGHIGQFHIDSVSYSAFDAIFKPLSDPDSKLYYVEGDSGNLGDDFESAQTLHRLVPDQLAECPECGAAAGLKDDPQTPKCFNCGYRAVEHAEQA